MPDPTPLTKEEIAVFRLKFVDGELAWVLAHLPRLLATIAERDAEIERLRGENERMKAPWMGGPITHPWRTEDETEGAQP